MTMTKKPLPYNTTPHYIAEKYRGGNLSINQLRVLLWLRTIGTPYGIATTSLNDLKHDVFPDLDLKINTINTILLKLRQKQHIYFEPRQGKPGTFDIKLNHWLSPNGYLTLDKYFPAEKQQDNRQDEKTDSTTYPQGEPSEDNQKLGEQNQKLEEMKSGLIAGMSINQAGRQIRSHHNEHDTEHQIENHDNVVKKSFNGTLVRGFNPTNYEQQRCRDMALELGEEFMNPILSVLRKDGFRRIETAWGIYREDRAAGKRIDNPPAYFHGIVKKLREQQ